MNCDSFQFANLISMGFKKVLEINTFTFNCGSALKVSAPTRFFFPSDLMWGSRLRFDSFARVTAADEVILPVSYPPLLSDGRLARRPGAGLAGGRLRSAAIAQRRHPNSPSCPYCWGYTHSFIFCAFVCSHAFLSPFPSFLSLFSFISGVRLAAH